MGGQGGAGGGGGGGQGGAGGPDPNDLSVGDNMPFAPPPQ